MEKNMQSIKYNGKTIKLPCDILNAEIDENYKKMQKCITWFQKHFTSQYYTLLD